MASKPKNLMGLCTCPECHFDEAEVKKTKAGLAYRWCPECNAQYFPRCKDTSDRLIAKCHTTVEAEAEAVPEEKPVPVPAKAPALAPVPAPVKPSKPEEVGPFDFLLKKEQATA